MEAEIRLFNDRRWIEQALERFERPLVRYATRLVGNVDSARDVVQECFLRLCKQPPATVEDRLGPWLFTVCRNCCIDLRRKQGRMDTQQDLDPTMSDQLDTVFDAVAKGDEMARVRQTVRDLPAREQEILRLKFQEGFTYRQIASVVEISETNVGFLLHRAMQTLRGRLTASANRRTKS